MEENVQPNPPFPPQPQTDSNTSAPQLQTAQPDTSTQTPVQQMPAHIPPPPSDTPPTVPTPPNPMPHALPKWFAIGAVLGVFLIFISTTYVLFRVKEQREIQAPIPRPKKIIPSPTVAATANWKTGGFAEQNFSFAYPADKIFPAFPEACFTKMIPDAGQAYWAYYQLLPVGKDPAEIQSDNPCTIPGEDGSQFEIKITPGITDLDALTESSAVESSKKMTIASEAAVMIRYKPLGGTGGNRIYFNHNEFTYYIYIPSEKSGPGTTIDPLFTQIISTFSFTKKDSDNEKGAFCGGIAGIACPGGQSCQLDGNYPDAGGTCIPGSRDKKPAVPTTTTSTYPDVVNKAIADFAVKSNIPTDAVIVQSYDEAEWNDSSLGCPQKDMMYLQVITPGYRLILSDGNADTEYHTDSSSKFVICK